MKLSWTALCASCALCLLCACAARRPDHFYILSAQPPGPAEARSLPAAQAVLRVSLPSLLDRPEMILNTSADGVVVLEHERWAAPLTDLVTQTLARDLERRRADLLVSEGINRAGGPVTKIAVEVVQMSVRRGESISIETHWRILDPLGGGDQVGGEVFSSPLRQEDYAAVARGLSECLALLADRLAQQLPAPAGASTILEAPAPASVH